MEIKSGDILFRSPISSDLSKAINDVTKSDGIKNYTHIGVADIIDSKVFVYHAAPVIGVVLEPLNSFQYVDHCKTKVDVYRLKRTFENTIAYALSAAKNLVGEQYNDSYKLDNPGYYCSEYVYHIWKDYKIFDLTPMTFINPETNDFHDLWINYYDRLNIEIPEGELGCNPNGLSRSSNIEYIKSLT